jgi:hypothetical protein
MFTIDEQRRELDALKESLNSNQDGSGAPRVVVTNAAAREEIRRLQEAIATVTKERDMALASGGTLYKMNDPSEMKKDTMKVPEAPPVMVHMAPLPELIIPPAPIPMKVYIIFTMLQYYEIFNII